MHLREHQEPVEQLHGVGPVLRRRLERLGIRSLDQLLRYYPNSYQDRRHEDRLKHAGPANLVNVLVRVRSRAWIGRGYKRV